MACQEGILNAQGMLASSPPERWAVQASIGVMDSIGTDEMGVLKGDGEGRGG